MSQIFRFSTMAALFALISPGLVAGGERPLTDQIIVQFESVAKANEHASPQALNALSNALGQEIAHSHFIADGSAQVLKLPGRLPVANVQALADSVSGLWGGAAEPDLIMQADLVPNDPYYSGDQWHYYESLAGINAPAAWDINRGQGAVVAIIDTGYLHHADLAANILPGYDMIKDTFVSNDDDGRDADATDPGDAVAVNACYGGSPARNSSWHGTHVGGTVAAVTNNSKGVAGVAYEAKILPVRVLGRCGGYTSDITDGMRWAAGLTVVGVSANPNPADVLNLSLGGGYSCTSTYQSTINAVNAEGATVVVSAGNSNADAADYSPAGCQSVITVASVNRSGDRAYYSNYGAAVEIAAPGGDSLGYILSTHNAGDTSAGADSYAFMQGTSMAAPHVSGVAALLYSAYTGLSNDSVLSAIRASSRPFPGGSSCVNKCGSGMLDAAQALASLSSPPPPPTVPTGLAAAASGSDTIQLSWRDNADNEASYIIERSADGSNWSELHTAAADTTSYTDTGLTASTTYYYRVKASNAAGYSDWSNTSDATTDAPPATPDVPDILSTELDSDTGVATISWEDVENETAYEVRREELHPKRGVWKGLILIATTAANTVFVNDAPSSGTYRYSIRALGTAGDSDWSGWVEIEIASAGGGGGDKPCRGKRCAS